jgi:hypothetical protein
MRTKKKALWKFVEEEKPPFVVNLVFPPWICGQTFHKIQNPSSAILVRELCNEQVAQRSWCL